MSPTTPAKEQKKEPAKQTQPATPATKPEVKTVGGLKVQEASSLVDKIKSIIFGDPFAGKTWLAGSASEVPELSPVLVIDLEAGAKTLTESWPGCEVITVKPKVNRAGQLVKTAWEVLDDIAEDLATYPPGQLPWKTIIFDNTSEGYNYAMLDVRDRAVEKAESRGRDVDEDEIEPKDYKTTEQKVRKMLRKYRNLDANVIFTAWASEKTTRKGDTDVREALRPAMAGKIERQVMGYFDEAWFIYVDDKGNRNLLTRERNKIKAKTRTKNLPTKLKNPTMKLIYGYISGAVKNEQTNETNDKEGTKADA